MERNKTIDIAKGIGILLVVLGHCAIPTKWFTLIYLFHMPLFFFTAGLVFRPSSDNEAFYQKKKRTLLFPYAVYGFLFVVVDTLVNNPSADGLLTNLLSLTFQIRYSSEWFLFAMFITVMLANTLVKKGDRVLNIAAVVLFSLLPILLFFFPNIRLPLSLTKIPVSLFYFAIGYNSKRLVEILNTKRAVLCIIPGIVAILVEVLSGYKVAQHMFCNIYRPYFVVPLFAISMIAMVMGVSFLLSKEESSILQFLGQNSLTILGVHQLCIYLVEYLLKSQKISMLAFKEFALALSISLIFVLFKKILSKNFKIFKYL